MKNEVWPSEFSERLSNTFHQTSLGMISFLIKCKEVIEKWILLSIS